MNSTPNTPGPLHLTEEDPAMTRDEARAAALELLPRTFGPDDHPDEMRVLLDAISPFGQVVTNADGTVTVTRSTTELDYRSATEMLRTVSVLTISEAIEIFTARGLTVTDEDAGNGSRSYYVNGQHAFDHDPHHTAVVRASFVRSTLNDLEA